MSDPSPALDPEARARWRLAVPDAVANDAGEGFPIGWFGLCASDALGRGEVLALRRFAQKLVAWRGADGVARALPARCAHAGVDMSVGSTVHGDWIECPFHRWRWDETGALREIPYSAKPIVQKAECRPRWPVREAEGEILVWHHPDRIDPLWEPAFFGEAVGRALPTVPVDAWRIAAGLAALRATAHDGAPSPLRVVGEGDSRRITADLSFRAGEGDVTGVMDVVAQGGGCVAISHSTVPGATLRVTLAPVDHALTEIRLTVATVGQDTLLTEALARAVARRIDDIKAAADAATAA